MEDAKDTKKSNNFAFLRPFTRFALKMGLILTLFLSGCSAAGNTITWETATETDTAGFNIYRGPGEEGPWAQVNEALIPPAEDPLRGGQYEFRDETAQTGETYFYQLEEVELSGSVNRYPPTRLQTGAALPAWPWWILGGVLAVGLGWLLGSRTRSSRSDGGEQA